MGTRAMVVGGTLLALAMWACGGSSEAIDEADGGPGPSAEDRKADASTSTGTGGMAAPDFGQLFGDFLPDCDPDIPMSATCGGEACPSSQFLAAGLCEVPCCAERDGEPVCGTRNTTLGATTTCVATPPPAQQDERCASAAFGNTELPGCCTENGVCGVISPLSQTCITESVYITLPQTPVPCSESTLPEPDAGTPPQMDAGMDVDANTNDPIDEDAGMPIDEDGGWPLDDDGGMATDVDAGP